MKDVWRKHELGFIGAVGLEFFRGKAVGMLVEVAYDSVPPSVKGVDLGGLQISIGGIF